MNQDLEWNKLVLDMEKQKCLKYDILITTKKIFAWMKLSLVLKHNKVVFLLLQTLNQNIQERKGTLGKKDSHPSNILVIITFILTNSLLFNRTHSHGKNWWCLNNVWLAPIPSAPSSALATPSAPSSISSSSLSGILMKNTILITIFGQWDNFHIEMLSPSYYN